MHKLLIILLFVYTNVFAQTETYNTGNIVLPTISGSNTTPWVNGVYQNSLDCWAPGMPGNCGPNPTVRPGNIINFSYGYTDLHQVQSLNNIFPNSGLGLKVDGYDFSFKAKNGNGWDDARTDVLFAYVQLNDKKNESVFNRTYNLNYQFNWSQFNLSETFINPYRVNELGSVRYGFIGQDNNFWAGTYGPEIINVSFNLRYSVDPCVTNPLYSASCPNFLEALSKTNSMPVQEPQVTNSSPAINETPINTSVAPIANSNNKENSGNSTNIGLSIVSRNKQRENAIINQTINSAIANANNAAIISQQEANSVVSQSVENSNTVNLSNTVINLGSGLRVDVFSSTQSNFTQPITSNPFQLNTSNADDNQPKTIVNQYSLSAGLNIDQPNTNIITDKTNPLNEYFENRTLINLPSNNAKQLSSVNKNIADNELAGEVKIETLASVPVGFDTYTNLTLKDSQFYAPKTIYRDQNNVDNRNALRQLTNDRKHQEMIDSQYRR